MMKKILTFILTLIIIITMLFIFTGCSNPDSKEKSNNENTTSDEEHLLNVLNGKEKYRSSLEEYDGIIYSQNDSIGQDYYINEIPYISEDITSPYIEDYAIIDLDGDFKNEIVAHINHAGGFVLVLHREDNINYGTLLSIREILLLKEDGRFCGSSSATNMTIHKAEFIDQMMNIKTIAYSYDENYFNGKDETISKEEFNKILNDFENTKDAEFIQVKKDNTDGNQK